MQTESAHGFLGVDYLFGVGFHGQCHPRMRWISGESSIPSVPRSSIRLLRTKSSASSSAARAQLMRLASEACDRSSGLSLGLPPEVEQKWGVPGERERERDRRCDDHSDVTHIPGATKVWAEFRPKDAHKASSET